MSILLHYYGDVVRKIFLVSGLIMVLTTPVFRHMLPASDIISIGAMAFLVFSAGLTSPLGRFSAIFNVFVALAAFFVFENHAITVYSGPTHNESHRIALFWVDLALSIMFLFAFYYSVKTLRGFFMK